MVRIASGAEQEKKPLTDLGGLQNLDIRRWATRMETSRRGFYSQSSLARLGWSGGRVPRDDSPGGRCRYATDDGFMVLADTCRFGTSCVVSNNVLHEAAVKQLIADLGNHAGETVISNNPGSLKVVAAAG